MIENKYALVDWVGEDSSSLVPCLQVGNGVFTIGEIAQVNTSEGTFEAIVSAVGKYDLKIQL